jgi:hypothetical protein
MAAAGLPQQAKAASRGSRGCASGARDTGSSIRGAAGATASGAGDSGAEEQSDLRLGTGLARGPSRRRSGRRRLPEEAGDGAGVTSAIIARRRAPRGISVRGRAPGSAACASARAFGRRARTVLAPPLAEVAGPARSHADAAAASEARRADRPTPAPPRVGLEGAERAGWQASRGRRDCPGGSATGSPAFPLARPSRRGVGARRAVPRLAAQRARRREAKIGSFTPLGDSGADGAGRRGRQPRRTRQPRPHDRLGRGCRVARCRLGLLRMGNAARARRASRRSRSAQPSETAVRPPTARGSRRRRARALAHVAASARGLSPLHRRPALSAARGAQKSARRGSPSARGRAKAKSGGANRARPQRPPPRPESRARCRDMGVRRSLWRWSTTRFRQA